MADGYRREVVLGKGSFGEAVLATDERSGSKVVMKTQSDKYGYAVRESQILETLRHRNIVRFIDSWQHGDVCTIVMEYCDGGDLRAAIRRRRKCDSGFPEHIIRTWLAQLTSALYYCHVQHILHRDLKAENVLLQRGQIKVADFGLSRAVDGTTAFATTRLGTPHYLPPEVYEHSPYNNRADMWCLGVLLYELLTLQRPFLGSDVPEVLQSIQHDEPIPAETISRNSYSAELYQLCRSLLNKDPTKRPSAGDILRLLWLSSSVPAPFITSDESVRERERAAWDRISVHASLAHSVMHELVSSSTIVNIRSAPTTNSEVVRVLTQGDVVEEISRLQPSGSTTVWYQLVDGYCIREHPIDPRKCLFREIPEWRVKRPGGTQEEPPALISANSVQSVSESGERAVSALLEREFESNEQKLASLLVFLKDQGLCDSMVKELFDCHAHLSSVDDDFPWTLFCVNALRPLHGIHCLRILRLAVAMFSKTP